jgi:hypothetical protein
MGTGELIMVCSSDSLRGCDGLGSCCERGWGLSVGLGTALVGMVAGMEGWTTDWLAMDCLLESELVLGG